MEVTPNGAMPCRKDPCLASARSAPAQEHAACGDAKLSPELEALIARAAVSCDVGLVHMGEDRAYAAKREAVLANAIRPLVKEVLQEEEKTRRYLHNGLVARIGSELFEVSQALRATVMPSTKELSGLIGKVEAARKATGELCKQFTLEHGQLDEGSAKPEVGTFRMPVSLIVDELERVLGGILVTAFPGPQLKKLLADLKGALVVELQALDVLRKERRALKEERTEREGKITEQHGVIVDLKREVDALQGRLGDRQVALVASRQLHASAEAELSRTKQALSALREENGALERSSREQALELQRKIAAGERLLEEEKTRIISLYERDLAVMRSTVGEWREHHRAAIKERDAALGELKQTSAELTLAKKDLATVEDSVRVLRQRCGEQLAEIEMIRAGRERAYQTLSTMPAPSEIAKLEEENAQRREELKDLSRRLRERDARITQLEDERQLHRANELQTFRIVNELGAWFGVAGDWPSIRKKVLDVRNELRIAEQKLTAALPPISDIAAALDASTRVTGGSLLSRVQRLVKRDEESHYFSVGLSKVRTALGLCETTPISEVVEKMQALASGNDSVRAQLRHEIGELTTQLEEAKHSAKQWSDCYEGDQQRIAKLVSEKEALERRVPADAVEYKARLDWEQRQISDALVSARADAAERKRENAALSQKISLLDHENKMLAERLGKAYAMEMDVRRQLADTGTQLDNVTAKMRERVSKLERQVDALRALKDE
jgi:DNA repair exonuclease SbcCD ATPase subunit